MYVCTILARSERYLEDAAIWLSAVQCFEHEFWEEYWSDRYENGIFEISGSRGFRIYRYYEEYSIISK